MDCPVAHSQYVTVPSDDATASRLSVSSSVIEVIAAGFDLPAWINTAIAEDGTMDYRKPGCGAYDLEFGAGNLSVGATHVITGATKPFPGHIVVSKLWTHEGNPYEMGSRVKMPGSNTQ